MNEDGPKSPQAGRPGEGAILGKIITNESVVAATKKAESLIEQANPNEALRVIEQLEAEVREMTMPSRFSRTSVVSEKHNLFSQRVLNPRLTGLTEDEYKRETLLIDLESLRNDIMGSIAKIRDVVLDIEATKEEG